MRELRVLLWRSRMARHVCGDERLVFDAPRGVNATAKVGVEALRVTLLLLTFDDGQLGSFWLLSLGSSWTSVPRQALAFDQ